MGSKARWAKIPAELAREVHRLIGEGRTEAEIVESVGIAKSSVLRIRHSQDPLLRRREWTPRSGCLSLSDRVEMAVGLGGGESFTTIAGRIGCHVSSVSREVGGRRGPAFVSAGSGASSGGGSGATAQTVQTGREPGVVRPGD